MKKLIVLMLSATIMCFAGKINVNFNDGTPTAEIDFSEIDNIRVISPPDGFAFVQGGTFQMGDHFGDGYSDELPLHSVTLSNFYIGKCEVTNQEYCDMMNYALGQGMVTASTSTVTNSSGNPRELLNLDDSDCEISYNGSSFVIDSGKENYPVLEVTWYGSVFYCNMISNQEGYTSAYNLTDWTCNWDANGYRLPTEAEWEYAARGGLTGQRFPNGATISHSTNGDTQANYYSSTSFSYDVSPTIGNHPDYNGTTSPVGSFPPNGFGLYDMSGNLFEWCWDWYSNSYYTTCDNLGTVTNPTGPASGTYRILQSSSRAYTAYFCRVAIRQYDYPYFGGDYGSHFGFRVVRAD